MTGNLTDATAALTSFRRGTMENAFSFDGSSRMVFLINGVIYKVNRDAEDFNTEEFTMGNRLRPLLPENVAIPEMSLFDIGGEPVLAMEFISGIDTGECSARFFSLECEDDGECMSDRLIANLNKIGWADSTWGNAILSNGTYFLIDVAV